MKLLIVIPARYGSTRFPGKPLAKLGRKTMLGHVIERALEAIDGDSDIDLMVATDDERIMHHASECGASAILTPESCKTGTDRVLSAVRQLPESPDYVMGLQGDVPLVPVSVIKKMITSIKRSPHLDVVTPVQNLSWDDLSRLRQSKKDSPYSGTTVVMNEDQEAIWFSKKILPALRKEKQLRSDLAMSPVWRHIGIYGYRVDVLERFATLPEGYYEPLEGLEQLRMIENNITIQCVPVDIPPGSMLSGIDTPEDLLRAEEIVQAQKIQ